MSDRDEALLEALGALYAEQTAEQGRAEDEQHPGDGGGDARREFARRSSCSAAACCPGSPSKSG